MFRIHTLLVLALLLAAVTASAIIPSTGLEPSKRELDTAIRYGSYGSSGGRDDGISSERGNDDRGNGRDVKPRGGPQGRKNDDMGPSTPGNREERDDSDEAEKPRGKGTKRGNRLGQGRGIGPVGKCNPMDPDCRTSEKAENPETKPPGIPGRNDNGIRAKGPSRGSPGRGRGSDKGRRPRSVRKCDPWNPECGMGTDDDDEPPCDPWDPDCGMGTDDDELPCDPWDPECGKEGDDEDELPCDPWKEDCKKTALFSRGKGPQGPNRRRGGKRNNAQGPMRRGNGVRRRSGPKEGLGIRGRKTGHSHAKKGGHSHGSRGGPSHGNRGRNSNPNRGRNSLGNNGGKGGKQGRY